MMSDEATVDAISPEDLEARQAATELRQGTIPDRCSALIQCTDPSVLQNLKFSVHQLDLRNGFLASRLTQAGDKIRFVLESNALTIESRRKGMRCSARIPLDRPSNVPEGQAVALEGMVELFAEVLCNPRQWSHGMKRTGDASEVVRFVARPMQSSADANFIVGAGLVMMEIRLDVFEFDWVFYETGSELWPAPEEPSTRIEPRPLAEAIHLVRSFAARPNEEDRLALVEVANQRAAAGSLGAIRTVDWSRLKDVNLLVNRAHAKDVAEVLKRCNPAEARLSIRENEQEFDDGVTRCIVERARLQISLSKRGFKQGLLVVTALTADVIIGLSKAMSQFPEPTDEDEVHISLQGSDTLTLVFSVPVPGGMARVKCPVLRDNSEYTSADPVSYEAWVDRKLLEQVRDVNRKERIEIHLRSDGIRFKEAEEDQTINTLIDARQKSRKGNYRFQRT